jgi:hypothetical protein
VDEAFTDCCFTSSGALWTALTWDDDAFVLEIREPETWQVVARAEVKDPFGGSHCMVLPHPDREHVAIWAAAGQNGQCLFWARRDGSKIIVDRFPDLDWTAPPGLALSEFLVLCDNNELRNYEFPIGPLRGKMRWPFDDTGNQIGDYVSFVDSGHALIDSTDNRLYLVDLEKMSEVCIRDPGPKLRPRWFISLPTGGFLSVHDGGDGCDDILKWHIPSSFDSL